MMLSQLFPDQRLATDVRVLGLADDSRQVQAGDLFFAYPGGTTDARQHLAQAVAAGAVALACEPPVPGADLGVPVVAVKHLRQQLGGLAAIFHGEPSSKLETIAVTGTNGKTSCTHFLAQALAALDKRCGVVGSLGYGSPECPQPTLLTTPDALALQRILRELAESGCAAVAMEASSHAMTQGRLNGTSIDWAVFTNLSRDHLDYHGSVEAYEAAKALLFQLPSLKGCVLNLDDDFGARLAAALPAAMTYGVTRQDAQIRCLEPSFTATGIVGQLLIKDERLPLSVPVLGRFNLMNLLAVAATLTLMGVATQALASCLAAVKPVRGRMDVLRYGGLPMVVVDFAHTPDALEKCLTALADHFPGRPVTCVFGCGGDRDPGKRPLMGQIAERHASQVLLTSDNPRKESPDKILDDIAAGMSRLEPVRIADRAEAIAKAVAQAGPDGLVLIAGKGHEEYQLVGEERRPFSDYEVVRALAESA